MPEGVLGALGVGGLLRGVLIRIGPADPFTLAGTGVLLTARMPPGPEGRATRSDVGPAGGVGPREGISWPMAWPRWRATCLLPSQNRYCRRV